MRQSGLSSEVDRAFAVQVAGPSVDHSAVMVSEEFLKTNSRSELKVNQD